MRKAFERALLPAVVLAAALAPTTAAADVRAAICHSTSGACHVEQEDGAEVVTFECSCSDLSEQSGEVDADPKGLFFACVESLGVCGDDPVEVDDFAAPVDAPASAPASDLEDDEESDASEAAGCRVGSGAAGSLALLLLPLVFRRRRS